MKKLSVRILKQVSSVGIGAGTIVSFISDFLIPIAPFALWLGLTALLLFSILTLYRLSIPSSRPPEGHEGIWYAPLAISTLFFSTICLSTYYISIQYKSVNGTETGFLSSNLKVVEILQENALSLNDIKEVQLKSLDEQIKTNKTLDDSKKAQLKLLEEQNQMNKVLEGSNKNLQLALNEQMKINEILSNSNEKLLTSIKEQKNINKTLSESKEIQKNLYENSISTLKKQHIY